MVRRLVVRARKDHQRRLRDKEAYHCVQKIREGGCTKKSQAVREAAKSLGRGERSVWTALKRYERDLKFDEWSERQDRIAWGEEEPTAKEIEEAGDWWIQSLIDRRRGK
jgi:hypothetical protein